MATTKTAHHKYLERLAKDSAKERVRRAREKVREAKKERRALKSRARTACQSARERVRAWARGERERVRAEIAAARLAAKGTCAAGRTQASTRAGRIIADAEAALRDETEAQKRERIWGGRARTKAPARELAQESDSEVLANLSDDEARVFQAVKGRIKASPRMSRTEAFQHWIHEHAGEVALILEKQVEREIAELERQEREAIKAYQRAQKSVRKATPEQLRESINASLADVPF